ncbi:S1 family peptidase [Actinomadura barringtoniae]|uniref:S1 family peptidase n=1 Tax=Actinomadura barringtoniae TaxID=1427535 RepID=A0A939P919_9ACTN|nr:S1 family peptidase [Actinomadura barringtoniae]MBO2448211.1 S1 family peptidase [Actinomadura barringtoniae]
MRLRHAACAVTVTATALLSAVVPNAAANAATPAAPTPPKPSSPAADQALAKLATRLEKNLGGAHSAGSYVDQKTGRLVVNVTDGSAAQSVRAAGATPRTVSHSRDDLQKATARLDRSARIPGTAWSLDPATDQVVVQADQSVTGARLAKLTSVTGKLGSSARLQRVPGRFSTHGPTMLDGTAVWSAAGRCTLGFNVFDGFGRHYFITAGHCTHAASDWYADSGLTSRLGTNAGHPNVFGPGGDYGIVEYDTAQIHAYGTVADSGKFITTSGDAVVGLSIRHDGSTTHLRGGHVVSLNKTVTYGDGTTVTGLIETDACSEPGDSGGPLYDGGSIALGILSGGNGSCSISGSHTVYQPVAPILRDFALTLWDVPKP